MTLPRAGPSTELRGPDTPQFRDNRTGLQAKAQLEVGALQVGAEFAPGVETAAACSTEQAPTRGWRCNRSRCAWGRCHRSRCAWGRCHRSRCAWGRCHRSRSSRWRSDWRRSDWRRSDWRRCIVGWPRLNAGHDTRPVHNSSDILPDPENNDHEFAPYPGKNHIQKPPDRCPDNAYDNMATS